MCYHDNKWEMKLTMMKVLLSIAGFDPSGGAGILLDMQVFRKMGFAGMAIPTADTVQNTSGVKNVQPHSKDLLLRQYQSLKEDVSFSGIKVGMISTKSNLWAVAEILAENQGIPIVVDPVMDSSSGYSLLEESAAREVLSVLAGKMTIITPNLKEAVYLSKIKIRNLKTAADAARRIYSRSGTACLVKGGHLPGDPVDILFDGKQEFRWRRSRQAVDVHGTGCFLSSAILALMACGKTQAQACEEAGNWAVSIMAKSKKLSKGRRVIVL
jgi:hydroxymethylpyrimidine/phosphomethylpyrimidine kinase